MIFEANELARAIFFFDEEGQISKEMHIAEFQAVLDGFVPLADLADTQARGCYIELDNTLCARRLVFFLLPINKSGEVLRAWYLPLMDLAASGRKAKDMGAGPVLLTCRSQCPSPQYKTQLWDPDLSPTHNQLSAIRKALVANRIGIQFREEEEELGNMSSSQRARVEQELSERLRREYAKEFRDHMAQLLKEQRLRIATSRNEFQSENLQLKREYEQRLDDMRAAVDREREALALERKRNAELQEALDNQARKVEAVREYFDHKLAQARELDERDVEALRDSVRIELEAKYEKSQRELREQLQMREVELLYHNERESQLNEELTRLRDEHAASKNTGGEQFLYSLVERGISFVSFQPGAGHLTIPVSDIPKYVANPNAYTAEQCGVSETRYEAWLTHYRMPVCSRIDDESGGLCGANIERVESPLDFEPGASDCCSECRKKQARSHLKLAGV